MTRPGVPTTTWTPTLQLLELNGVVLAAEDRQDPQIFQMLAVGFKGFGHLNGKFPGGGEDENLRTLVLSVRSRVSSGRAKAAVLPVPVWAWPTTSLPASTWGIISCWMGVGTFVAGVVDGLEKGAGKAKFGKGKRSGIIAEKT